nr:MAG TPA: hypothetical protein [Caudoviricetes sp.]
MLNPLKRTVYRFQTFSEMLTCTRLFLDFVRLVRHDF